MDSCSRKKITDLNIDCLEKIFRYLDDQELMTIADCLNRHLKSAAELVFVSRNSHRSLKITELYNTRPNYFSLVYIRCGDRPHQIYTCNFKLALQLLRCFGHLLLSLYIQNFRTDETLLERFTEYIKKYLHGAQLKKVTFRFKPNVLDGLLNGFDKPFPNSEYVGIVGGILARGDRLNYLFPKMQRLNFFMDDSIQLKDIAYHFPHLKELQVYINSMYIFLDVEMDLTELDQVFSFNPQLNKLILPFHPHKIYSKITEMLPVLESLELNLYVVKGIWRKNIRELNVNVFNVRRFKIDFGCFNGRKIIPFEFQNLEELTISNENILLTDIRHFLNTVATVTKLTLSCRFLLQEHNHNDQKITLLDLANTLPILEEINLYRADYCPREVVRLMKCSKSIKTIRARVVKESDYAYIQSNIDSNWQISTFNKIYQPYVHVLLKRICS